ncbi:MAG: NtaA/DmoA family FMN-dependent monooxygenase [Pseudomonas sp.]
MSTPLQRPLCIGLSLAITWLTGDGWRRADSDVERIHTAGFYLDIARRAERAGLDFLFRPDALFLDPQALERGPGFSSLEPTVLLAAIAHATARIGLVTTASTRFNPPYAVARQLQSLSWVSDGRAGWNIVTSLDGGRNFGAAAMSSSQQRYAQALEFTEAVLRLWRSFPHEALLVDREAGRFADAGRIAPIDHAGAFFQVQGPLNIPAHPSGRLPLFQAGASPWGRDFAARVADAVFAASPDLAAGIELRQDLRARAQAHGRRAEAIRVLPGLSLYLGDSAEEARELYQATHARQDRSRGLAYLRELIGLDLSGLAPDQPVTAQMLPDPAQPVRSHTHAELVRRLIARERPTVDTLLARPEVAGSAHWRVVGTVEDALAEIRARVQAGAADGFIALPGGALRSLELLLDELVPRLAEQGLFRDGYAGTTLREHLGIED